MTNPEYWADEAIITLELLGVTNERDARRLLSIWAHRRRLTQDDVETVAYYFHVVEQGLVPAPQGPGSAGADGTQVESER
jgi:hypothetical protein